MAKTIQHWPTVLNLGGGRFVHARAIAAVEPDHQKDNIRVLLTSGQVMLLRGYQNEQGLDENLRVIVDMWRRAIGCSHAASDDG